jgi:hypothetical protein
MDNIFLMRRDDSLVCLVASLGFSRNLFLDDVLLLKEDNKKKLSKKYPKLTLFEPSSEDMLRFVLERSPIDVVYGIEKINHKDSVHFVRGGLDQILCRIAKAKGKTIGFDLAGMISGKVKMNRVIFNMKLCKKYGVETAWIMKDLISKNDLDAFIRVLRKNKLY